ncbi:MAG TPA: glycosyltransferase family 4 protein [Bacteroidales bacterium]|nr:glycosyltransferase family 4 protein [Bacteroidales bacterium]
MNSGRNQSIVILATPVLLRGGTENQLLSVLKALKNCGFRVHVLCYFEFHAEMADHFRAEGAEVTLLRYQREGKSPIVVLLRLLWNLFRWFRKNKPDIVHVQYLAPGFIPVLAAKMAGIRNIMATVHQPCPPGLKAKCLLQLASMMTNRFICVSQAVERSWFGRSNLFTPGDALPRRSHFTIYNAIDPEEIRQIVSSEDPVKTGGQSAPEHGLVIGAVSRLRHEKGMDILLKSFALLLPRFPGIRLKIVGDGPDRETLHNLAGELFISGVITWTGEIPRKEAIRQMQSMDMVVIPSRFEGFGLVAAESMACGKSVIASNTGGLPEIIDDRETGWLAPPEDPVALAEALTELIDNPALREKLGAAGRRRVGEKFSFTTFARQIEALYAAKQ